VIVLAAIIGRFFVEEQQKALDAEVRGKAGIMAASLQRELKAQMKLLAILGESPRLDPPISTRAFAEIARRMREQMPEWEQIRISDSEGKVVLAVPEIDNVGKLKIVDMASHDFVVRQGAPTIGNIAIGQGGKAAFAVRVPIRRKDKVRAVLSVVMRPSIITDFLYANGLPSLWSAWIVDGQDRLVASTGGPALAGGEASGFASFTGTDFGTGRLNDGTQLRVAEIALEDTPWTVRVGIPRSEYEALSRKASMLLVAASCFTLLLSGSAVFLFLWESRARSRERETIANWQRMDALGKLTGQVAHDFNNLLMVFHAGVEGIKRRRHDEQRVTQLLAHMANGVARGKVITQRLLSFSRKSNQGAEPIDLEVKFAEVLPLLQQAANDGIVIAVDVRSGTWSAHADPTAFEIALVNLVTNAREAMPNGGEITISTKNVRDGQTEDIELRGQFVAVTVADNGLGIQADRLKHVFEPFYSAKKGNIGLGLTQVYSFAKGSGGSVKAASLLGRGSAFTLLLPKSKDQGLLHDTPNTASLALPRSIMIVDDTAASLESVRLLLEPLIPSVITASDGIQALDLLGKHPGLEAVLSDILMPSMSGIELAAKISQFDRRLPVVLMTGYSDKLEEGADVGRPVVAKPFMVGEFSEAFVKAKASLDADNIIRLNVEGR